MKTVWTIGHSTRTMDELVEVLTSHGIEIVADVRRFPVSSRVPHFNREIFSRELLKMGLGYHWLGELLGGYRKGGYKSYTATEAFRRGLASLERMAGRRCTALLCAEAVYFRCHRRHIADALAGRGWEIIHIFDAKRTELHRVRPRQGKMFSNPGM